MDPFNRLIAIYEGTDALDVLSYVSGGLLGLLLAALLLWLFVLLP